MNYAFGYAGDRDLLRNAHYLELWKRIENPSLERTQNAGLKTAIIITPVFDTITPFFPFVREWGGEAHPNLLLSS